MKSCWDNLSIIFLKNGNFYKSGRGTKLHYYECCMNCGMDFVSVDKGKKFCSKSCFDMSLIGKNLSSETRLKISKAHKGKQWRLGAKLSEETKEKIGKKNRGRSNTAILGDNNPLRKYPELAILIGIKNSGENSPRWKGGISTEPYCCVWVKEYKEEIKGRDKYLCLNPSCSKKSNRLSVHHIDYNKKNCHPLNLITLCASCNSIANSDRQWYKSYYQTIICKRYPEWYGLYELYNSITISKLQHEWIRQAVIVFNHIIDEQELRFDEPTQTTIIKLLKIAIKIEKRR